MIHRFGVFEFDSDRGELRKNGRAVALEPQPGKALALLLSKPDDVVTRDEVRDALRCSSRPARAFTRRRAGPPSP